MKLSVLLQCMQENPVGTLVLFLLCSAMFRTLQQVILQKMSGEHKLAIKKHFDYMRLFKFIVCKPYVRKTTKYEFEPHRIIGT